MALKRRYGHSHDEEMLQLEKDNDRAHGRMVGWLAAARDVTIGPCYLRSGNSFTGRAVYNGWLCDI